MDYSNLIVKGTMLIVNKLGFMIIFPVTINYVFIFVGSSQKSQGYSEIDFSRFVGLLVESLDCLPFGPTARNEHFIGHFFAL